jgi:hypothetical protein
MSTKLLFVKGWQVKGIRSAEKFFSAVPEVLPLPVHLCFVGGSVAPNVRALFESAAVEPGMQIPAGIWPAPSIFHVLATEQIIRDLAALAGKHAGPEICIHFHAYNNGRGLMQWYDAFDDPLLIDESIPETQIQKFCKKLGVEYSPWKAA